MRNLRFFAFAQNDIVGVGGFRRPDNNPSTASMGGRGRCKNTSHIYRGGGFCAAKDGGVLEKLRPPTNKNYFPITKTTAFAVVYFLHNNSLFKNNNIG